jgi:hypothetical protein
VPRYSTRNASEYPHWASDTTESRSGVPGSGDGLAVSPAALGTAESTDRFIRHMMGHREEQQEAEGDMPCRFRIFRISRDLTNPAHAEAPTFLTAHSVRNDARSRAVGGCAAVSFALRTAVPGPVAARMHSLIRPLWTGFRRIWSVSKSAAAMTQRVWCSVSGTRWPMPWCGRRRCSAPGIRPVRLAGALRLGETTVELAPQGADEALADRVHPRRMIPVRTGR